MRYGSDACIWNCYSSRPKNRKIFLKWQILFFFFILARFTTCDSFVTTRQVLSPAFFCKCQIALKQVTCCLSTKADKKTTSNAISGWESCEEIFLRTKRVTDEWQRAFNGSYRSTYKWTRDEKHHYHNSEEYLFHQNGSEVYCESI